MGKEQDVKGKIEKPVKQMSINAMSDGRAAKEVADAAKDDKNLAKLAKAVADAHPPYAKALRALLDAVNKG